MSQSVRTIPLLGPQTGPASDKFDTLADFNTAGGAAGYGVGPLWIGGAQYWSNGSSISAAGGSATVVTITGTASVGSTLTATLGDGWSATSYQWMRDDGVTNQAISGETTYQHTLVTADAGKTITCVVSGLTYEPTGLQIAAITATYDSLISDIRFNGNLTATKGGISGLAMINGGANNFTDPNGLSLSSSLSQRAEMASGTGFNALTMEMGKVFVFEFDFIANTPVSPNTSNSAVLLDLNDVDGSTGGARIGLNSLNLATATADVNVRCSTWIARLDPSATFKNGITFTRANRTHLVIVVDTTMTASGAGVGFYAYIDGVQRGSGEITALTASQTNHTGNFCQGASGKKIVFGNRQSGATRDFDGTIYNARIWKLNSLPVNISALVAELFTYKDSTPPSWGSLV